MKKILFLFSIIASLIISTTAIAVPKAGQSFWYKEMVTSDSEIYVVGCQVDQNTRITFKIYNHDTEFKSHKVACTTDLFTLTYEDIKQYATELNKYTLIHIKRVDKKKNSWVGIRKWQQGSSTNRIYFLRNSEYIRDKSNMKEWDITVESKKTCTENDNSFCETEQFQQILTLTNGLKTGAEYHWVNHPDSADNLSIESKILKQLE